MLLPRRWPTCNSGDPVQASSITRKGVGTANEHRGLTVNLDEVVVWPETARDGPAMSARMMRRCTAATRSRQREQGGGSGSEVVHRVKGSRGEVDSAPN
jgi:hypothetical protein